MTKRSALLQRCRDRLPSPSATLRKGYRAAWSDAQCRAWGERVAATTVLRQAEAWLLTAERVVTKVDTAYSPRRLAWLAELMLELDAAVAAQPTPPDRDALTRLTADARVTKTRLLRRMRLWAGGDEARNLALSGVDASSAELSRSLGRLLELAARWRRDALGEALADDVGLTRAWLQAAEVQRAALVKEEEVHLGWSRRRQGDGPVIDVMEGRVLRELRALQLAFLAARKESKNAPVMRVFPGLRAFLAPQATRARRAPKDSPPRPE